MSTKVTTQQELDTAISAGAEDDIIIDSPRGVWIRVGGSSHVVVRGSSHVVVRGSSRVEAWDSSSVEAWGSSYVVARDSSSVEAWDSSRVEAWGSSYVVARGSSHVDAMDSSSVVAWGSSYVAAWGSSYVVARGSSSVEAWDSSRVEAWDSSHVVARDSSSVVARGSSHVDAMDSSSVVARDSSSVVARDSSSVVAWGSSHVAASRFVAVHLHSAHATVTGGVVIDITALDLTRLPDWADYHGVDVVDGEAIVYKAVGGNLRSGRGFAYPLGETVTCPDWDPTPTCGAGLHFSPHPTQARDYYRGATRYLRCAVPVTDLVVIDGHALHLAPKVKARSARVLCEVDIHGDEMTKDES